MIALLLALGTCPPKAELRQLKAAAPGDALVLVDCLADPDPEIRDELAFDIVQRWLRSGAVPDETVRAVGERLLPRLTAPDPQGFARPFAALALSEVVRVDRIKPFLTAAERERMVEGACAFEKGVRDYRGFDEKEGWRHGVAHGADWLLQLALNPEVGKPQLDRMLDAIASQIAPAGHFYVFGEGQRLARATYFIASRGLHTRDEWAAWLARAAPASEALAAMHDAREFLFALYVMAAESDDAALRDRLLPGLRAAVRMRG
ncbi:MAG TPA: DUF2785 domain-containing protein [Myxococcales bacterium]|nr:DUF2785 domain-containing protein [Myxococcales bacterium]